MPEIQSIRDWTEPRCPVRIEAREQVAQEICRLAIDGLLALPRVGLGAGGLLLGSHDGRTLAITGLAPIHCSHSLGPGFRLSPGEIEAARNEFDVLSIVGCYCSTPGGLKPPGESGLAFFNAFCPEPWQIMLQVRPSTVEPCRLVVYFRDHSGDLIQGRERTFVQAEAENEDEAEAETEFKAPQTAPPEPVNRPDPPPPAFLQATPRRRQTFGIVIASAMAAAAAIALFFRVW